MLATKVKRRTLVLTNGQNSARKDKKSGGDSANICFDDDLRSAVIWMLNK